LHRGAGADIFDSTEKKEEGGGKEEGAARGAIMFLFLAYDSKKRRGEKGESMEGGIEVGVESDSTLGHA